MVRVEAGGGEGSRREERGERTDAGWEMIFRR